MSGLMKAMGFGGGYTVPKSVDELMHEYEFAKQMQMQNVGVHTNSIAGNTRAMSWKDMKRKLLMMRLDISDGMLIPFEFLEFMQGEECAYVIVAVTKKDKPVIIEDDAVLFPSDTLITQLRLMLG